jgi:DnaJ like chaperone protein
MSIWERITGAAEKVGMGALFERLADAIGGESGGPPRHGVAFTIAVVALGAKMAKADGHVTRDEVDAFKEAFRFDDSETKNVARVFDLAREDVAGYESYADDLGRLHKGDRRLLQDVLEGLFHIATVDSTLYPSEDAFLSDVARRFGFTMSEYRFIRSRFVEDGQRSPYEVLKIEPTASDAEVKARYRHLVAANHPDKFIARGMPKEAIEIANRKLAAINEAYDVIARERGLK